MLRFVSSVFRSALKSYCSLKNQYDFVAEECKAWEEPITLSGTLVDVLGECYNCKINCFVFVYEIVVILCVLMTAKELAGFLSICKSIYRHRHGLLPLSFTGKCQLLEKLFKVLIWFIFLYGVIYISPAYFQAMITVYSILAMINLKTLIQHAFNPRVNHKWSILRKVMEKALLITFLSYAKNSFMEAIETTASQK